MNACKKIINILQKNYSSKVKKMTVGNIEKYENYCREFLDVLTVDDEK